MKRPDWTAAVDKVLAAVEGLEEREAERALRERGYPFSDSTIRRWRAQRGAGAGIPAPRAPAKDVLLRFVQREGWGPDSRSEGGFYGSLLHEAGESLATSALDARAREMTGVLNRLVWLGKLTLPAAIEAAWEIVAQDGYDKANKGFVTAWEAAIRSAMERPNGGNDARGGAEG